MLLGGLNTIGNGFTQSIAASGHYLFAANGPWGLQILRIGSPQEVHLSAQRVGSELQLRWPIAASNYMLEITASLSLPNWQTVSGTPQVQDDFYLLNLPPTNSAAFFRLRRP